MGLARRLLGLLEEKLDLPKSLSGFERYGDLNSFYKELARYRRHDHGGGSGDDWLPDYEIKKDFDLGKSKFGHVLKQINDELKKNGFKPNAKFELGEKGHFSISIKLEKE